MPRVLVTGGTGVLGRELVPRLAAAGHMVRVMSRHGRPAEAGGVEWVMADLASGQGLDVAVAQIETVVHAASSPTRDTRQVDVEGTRRLLEAARQAGTGHVVYISIVGIERVALAYYQRKLQAERVVENGGVPWTILRTTQFFDLIDLFFRRATRKRLMFVAKDFRFQPIAVTEVAEALVAAVAAGPAGRLPDMGGPEVKTAGELVANWLAAQGQRRRVLHLPRLGRVAAGYRAGHNTAPDRAVGRLRWADWLAARYGRAGA